MLVNENPEGDDGLINIKYTNKILFLNLFVYLFTFRNFAITV